MSSASFTAEGKISIELKHLQRRFLLQHNLNLSNSAWMKGLIEHLFVTAHEHWIYRNLCKHYRTRGSKALAARDENHLEIERQLELGADDLPDHGRCLLEICPDHLYGIPSDRQQYWSNAVEAARVELFAQSASTSEEKQDGSSTGNTTGHSQRQLAPIFLASQRRARARQASASPPAPPPTTTETDRLNLLQRCQQQFLSYYYYNSKRLPMPRSMQCYDVTRSLPAAISGIQTVD